MCSDPGGIFEQDAQGEGISVVYTYVNVDELERKLGEGCLI